MTRILGIGLLMLTANAWAQDVALYRLQFALRETENGKAAATHTYTMQVLSHMNNRLNAGTKVPVPSAPGSTAVTYVDVGVNIRAKVEERGSLLLLDAEIEVSNLGADRENTGSPAPRIQQLRATVNTAIPPGQSVPIATLDDPASPRHFEIQVTATKVK